MRVRKGEKRGKLIGRRREGKKGRVRMGEEGREADRKGEGGLGRGKGGRVRNEEDEEGRVRKGEEGARIVRKGGDREEG